MKGIDRATIHRHNRENYTGLLHILKSKQIFLGFLSFANFYLVLAMQFFMDFLVLQIFICFPSFANFYGFHAIVLKMVEFRV